MTFDLFCSFKILSTENTTQYST